MALVETTLSKPLLLQILAAGGWMAAALVAGGCGDHAGRRVAPRHPASSALDHQHFRRTYVRADQRDLPLDLYLPRAGSGPVPVIVMFHGGGWSKGSPSQARGDLQPFLAAGWAGVTPAYRLAPSARAPAAIEDAECALRWVGVHAAEYGMDRGRIVVAGYSAGGYLALMLGIGTDSTALARNCSRLPRPRPALVVNLAGIADLEELLAERAWRDWAVQWVGPTVASESLAAAWSPLRRVHAGGVPVLTLHGDNDEVVPYGQSVRLHRALDRLGVPNRLVTLPGTRHALPQAAGGLAEQEATALLGTYGRTPTPAGGRPSSR